MKGLSERKGKRGRKERRGLYEPSVLGGEGKRGKRGGGLKLAILLPLCRE